MFAKIRQRLLISYLLVLASILIMFALGVRIVFARSLERETIDNLTLFGEAAAASAELENNRLKVASDLNKQNLLQNDRSVQWFDLKGHLVYQIGKDFLTLPFSTKRSLQTQTINDRIQGLSLPIISNDSGRLIGYVRVSQSLKDVDETLEKLDWNLGRGIAVALVGTGIGGVVLTQEAMKPIENSFDRLKQFTADASHELRSPLMAIKSNAAVALKYPEGIRETDLEKFEAIANATNQMTRLTEDLLLLARTERVTKKKFDPVNLTQLLEDLIELNKPQALSKGIDLTASLEPGLYVRGDSPELTRLFSSLLENALSYTPSNGSVQIASNRAGWQVDIEVRDTGIGIASENLQKVFERFWRADRSRSYNSGGSGLGLAIAQAIAVRYGALIQVTSELDIGSCFTVSLPLLFAPKN